VANSHFKTINGVTSSSDLLDLARLGPVLNEELRVCGAEMATTANKNIGDF
jgi:hypothetical protein